MKSKIIKNYKWIHFISSRISGLDRKSRFASSKIISALGIGFGVMALIVIVSVMNGFQGTSINSLMEISSYHLRLTNCDLDEKINSISEIKCVTPFLDAQGLLVGNRGKQHVAMIRGLQNDCMDNDAGFAKQIEIVAGDFDLSSENAICLGISLAKALGVTLGDNVNIFALSGDSNVEMFDSDRVFTVKAIFSCSYGEINSSVAFIPLGVAAKMLGKENDFVYGVKLKDYNKDVVAITKLSELYPATRIESWRDFNKSFFGALKIEKNVLMIIVFLIFLVVAINIYNGMRRMVFERKEEICVLQALGASKKSVQLVFILQGLYVGVLGSVPGLLLGLFVSVNIKYVFTFLANFTYWFNYFATMLIHPERIYFISQNRIFNYYADIPAIINFNEIFYITIFGIFSAVISSYLASRKIMQFEIAEVLHDE